MDSTKDSSEWTCSGRHWGESIDEGMPAEYFRECGWCGSEIHLCAEHRGSIFLCDFCFTNQRSMGKEKARRRGRLREFHREQMRRINLRRGRLTYNPQQLDLPA